MNICAMEKVRHKIILEDTKSIKSRSVLWYLTFIGFAVNYMLRINANITIVDMVQLKLQKGKNLTTMECYNQSISNDFTLTITHSLVNGINKSVEEWRRPERVRGWSIERYILDKLEIPYDINGFKWNEHQQAEILGSFFWLHWLTQVPGGLLARRYGTKIVFGLANVIPSLLCFLVPMAAYWEFKYIIFIRVLQGFITGVSWPAMHNMTAQWIPPNERSKFVTAYLGSSIGIAVCYPLFGYIISFLSWEWVFHFSGIFGAIWFIGWLYFVYDSPADHPRIDPIERDFIQNSLGKSIQKNIVSKVPWKAMLTERSVWMIVIAQWGGIWGVFTMMTQAPSYFKYIHGWGIEMTGILSGMPHIMRVIFAMVFSSFGDYMLRSGKMSPTAVRKLAGFICCVVNGCFMILLAYSGCNSLQAFLFLAIGVSIQGAVSTGPLANCVDLSPNYASLLLGLSGAIGCIPGFISPIIVGYLTYENQTVQQWKYIFLICGGTLVFTGTLFVLFGDSKLKPWNNPDSLMQDERELQELKLSGKYELYTPSYELDPLNEKLIDVIKNEQNETK